jgi:hypothetical protein
MLEISEKVRQAVGIEPAGEVDGEIALDVTAEEALEIEG